MKIVIHPFDDARGPFVRPITVPAFQGELRAEQKLAGS